MSIVTTALVSTGVCMSYARNATEQVVPTLIKLSSTLLLHLTAEIAHMRAVYKITCSYCNYVTSIYRRCSIIVVHRSWLQEHHHFESQVFMLLKLSKLEIHAAPKPHCTHAPISGEMASCTWCVCGHVVHAVARAQYRLTHVLWIFSCT